jgi:hypothetical protein
MNQFIQNLLLAVCLAMSAKSAFAVATADCDPSLVVVGHLGALTKEGKYHVFSELTDPLYKHAVLEKYARMNDDNWTQKWDKLQESIIAKATKDGFEKTKVVASFSSINRGRNRKSFIVPAIVTALWLPNDKKEEIERKERDAEEQNKKLVESFNSVPIESHFDDSWRVVPVGLFSVTHKGELFYVLLCAWTFHAENVQTSYFNGVCTWVLKADDAKIVEFSSCD